jgi:hypothetical protein
LWTTTCPISGSGLSPACCLPFCLSSLYLLRVHMEISPLLSPPSSVCFWPLYPSAVCYFSVPCLLFRIFLQGVVQSAQEAMLVYLGVAGGIPHDTRRSPVWAAECLPSRFGAGIWWWQLSCFLNVMWHGEAFYGLGVQGVKFRFSLVLYFHQVWLQCLNKVLESQSSCCLLLCPSLHLGSE